jgi:hypothetical protein
LEPKLPKDKVGLIQIAGGAAEQCYFMKDYHDEAVTVGELHNVRCPLSQIHHKNQLR